MSKPGEYELLRLMVRTGVVPDPGEAFWRERFPEEYAADQSRIRYARRQDREPKSSGELMPAEKALAEKFMRHWMLNEPVLRYAADQYRRRRRGK